MKQTFRFLLRCLFKAVVLIFIAGLGLFGCIYRQLGDTPKDTKRFEQLSYFKDGRFISPRELPYWPEKRTGEVGWFGYGSPSPNAPKNPLPTVHLSKTDFATPEALAYYWLGHASAILEFNHQRILIDPVFENASPVPFTMPRYQPAPIKIEQLPHIDVVLITHDHYDHLEADTMRYLADKATHFITPLGVGSRLQSWGVPAEKITELGWTDSVERNGIKYTAERTNHYSARWFNDRNKTLWAAYILESAGKKLFWSCDGGYDKHFFEYGKKYGGFDAAFVEIDAANAGWPYTHMSPEQAIQAVQDLQAKIFLPIHWGVFDLGVHPWDESIKKTAQLADEQGILLVAPKLGEKYTFDKTDLPRWWESHR